MILTIPLSITLRAPYTVRGNLVGHYGVDAPLFRTANNELAIPGTLIIGKLADAFRHISELGGEAAKKYADYSEKLFATGSQKVDPKKDAATTGRELRRRITAGDFICAGKDVADVRTRIAIDNVKGTVSEGMLQVLEQAKKPNDEITFTGEVRISGEHDDEVEKHILKAARWITQIGGLRTVGYGEVVSIKRLNTKMGKTVTGTCPSDGPVGLRLRFRDVFCVGEKRTDTNTYTSAAVVSGAAIKGALAQQILAHYGKSGTLDGKSGMLADHADKLPEPFSTLAKNYSSIRFRHAFPFKKNTEAMRNGPLPLSLALADKAMVDRAGPRFDGRPVLIADHAPKPMDDWKSDQREDAKKAFRINEPAKDLRVRTQIDPKTKAAKENRLFAIEYRSHDTHDFVMAIDLPDGPNRTMVAEGLRQALENGLAGIGRGGACCDVEFCTLPSKTNVGHTIILKAPALLRCPSPGAFPDLTALYQKAFDEIGLAGTGFRLKTLFADEDLAGHAFIQMRRKQPDFMPFLLTKAGAVFVFENDDPAAGLPESWFNAGLPLPKSVRDFHGFNDADELWRVCPYVPENGYGEIEIHNPAAFDGEIAVIDAIPLEDVA